MIEVNSTTHSEAHGVGYDRTRTMDSNAGDLCVIHYPVKTFSNTRNMFLRIFMSILKVCND